MAKAGPKPNTRYAYDTVSEGCTRDIYEDGFIAV